MCTCKAEAQTKFQLRSNIICDLALCPNIGVAIQHGAYELSADYIGAWWNHDATHHYFSNYALQTEVRYYPGQKKEMHGYNVGRHIGIYGQMTTYDFEFGGTGYMCKKLNQSWGCGAAFGYQLYLTQDLNLDLTAGVGFFHTQYDRYIPGNENYYRTNIRKKDFFGPTKLEATLVWKFFAQ